MTITEKSAYLKGLMDGLNLNTQSDEGKMIVAIVDLLGDVTQRMTDIEETTIAISDEPRYTPRSKMDFTLFAATAANSARHFFDTLRALAKLASALFLFGMGAISPCPPRRGGSFRRRPPWGAPAPDRRSSAGSFR